MEIFNLVATRFNVTGSAWAGSRMVLLDWRPKHSESFNRRMEEAQALNQQWKRPSIKMKQLPAPEDDDRAIAKAHEGLAKESGHCLSVPIHSEEVSMAALCCERGASIQPFETQLELAAQLLAVARDLKRRTG